MSLLQLQFPPGMVRPATVYDARGRWYDGNLVRWHEGVLQPVGGWGVLSGAHGAAVGAPVRGMLAWRRNDGSARIALGTYQKLLVYNGGVMTDITPSGFSAGSVDQGGSFWAPGEATGWQLANFGEDLVAVASSDNNLYYWNGAGLAAPITPTSGLAPAARAVVVTPERFLVALSADLNARQVRWADQESSTEWEPRINNQAGSFELTAQGTLVAGRATRQETLLWTTDELFAMRYIGGSLVYAFPKVGEKCGLLGRRAVALEGTRAFWMGNRGFFVYDGYAQPLPCPVAGYVFSRLNRAQASKISAVINSDFHEVTWYYPSGTENDSYVTHNYQTGDWWTGTLPRTDGVDRGSFEYPMLASPAGAVYEHEKGTTYQDETGTTYTPYVESGPLELGNGDRLMDALSYIPDEETLGEVQTTLYTRMYPTGAETTHGPFTNANPTDVRITGRQVRIRHTQVSPGWRVGTPRLDVQPGSGR